ncbi:MAG: hypothetical protein ABII00_10240 [Elusimicrobiota bacterium]
MNKAILAVLIFGAAGLSAGCGISTVPAPKFLIILQAGTEGHEGMARALHAILYAQELKKGGHEVALMFDGAGTGWARKFKHRFSRSPNRHADITPGTAIA